MKLAKGKCLGILGLAAEVEKCGWKSQTTPLMPRDHSRVSLRGEVATQGRSSNAWGSSGGR